ncbi:MAG: tRNA (mnm(5)s(2)U34)-methyltransferase [Clostridium sp.]
MYRYIDDISKIAQNIIKEYVIEKKVAIDCTLGNGHDTDFLATLFEKVYSFDIQKEACEKYLKKEIKNVVIINESHDKLINFIKEEKVDCIMYNLGFLPGNGNKWVTTKADSTISSINEGLELLRENGIMTICIYVGHDEGKKEEACIMELVSNLPKNKFAVLEHKYINRSMLAPRLLVIEKNA